MVEVINNPVLNSSLNALELSLKAALELLKLRDIELGRVDHLLLLSSAHNKKMKFIFLEIRCQIF